MDSPLRTPLLEGRVGAPARRGPGVAELCRQGSPLSRAVASSLATCEQIEEGLSRLGPSIAAGTPKPCRERPPRPQPTGSAYDVARQSLDVPDASSETSGGVYGAALRSLEVLKPKSDAPGQPPQRPHLHRADSKDHHHPAKDIVQWTAPIYFVEESERKLTVEVMRLGSLQGTCKVQYRTEDGSAKAGQKYRDAAGQIVFRSGEHTKSVTVSIIESDVWASTLEFKILLCHPKDCELGLYLHAARVKIIDNDIFPSSRFAEEIESGEGESIPSTGLLLELFKLLLNSVEGVRWRTAVIIVLDQLWNLYTLLTLFLNQYLVDVLFNVSDEEESSARLFTHRGPSGGRIWTSFIVAALYVGPMVLLHAWDYQKAKLDLGGLCREYLQENLFRKYLNYSETSRALPSATPSHMQVSIIQDTAEAVEAFEASLNLAQCLGKLVVLVCFILKENASAIVPIVLMPLFMTIFVGMRSKVMGALGEVAATKTAHVIELVSEACSKYRLIADYQQRPQMCELFSERVHELSESQLPVELVLTNNRYFPLWLGPLFTGIYLCIEAQTVLNRGISLGTFTATIKVFAELSEQLSESYKELMTLNKSVGPIRKLTSLFNYQTDLMLWKTVNRKRRELTKAARLEAMTEGKTEGKNRPRGDSVMNDEPTEFRTDKIGLRLRGVVFSYIPIAPLLRNVSVDVEQGKMVAVVGAHGSGKSTLLRLLGHSIFPDDGLIFIPTHLRILHVSQESVMLKLSAWQNLTFGSHSADPKRVRSIIEDLSMPNVVPMVYEDLKRLNRQEEFGDKEPLGSSSDEDEDDNKTVRSDGSSDDHLLEPTEEEEQQSARWQDTLPHTEKAKLHLARALIVSPEVLVLHRPLQHYDRDTAMRILGFVRKFVDNRGFHLAEHSCARRRPRTCFFTPNTREQAQVADIVWQVGSDGQVRSMAPKLLEESDFT